MQFTTDRIALSNAFDWLAKAPSTDPALATVRIEVACSALTLSFADHVPSPAAMIHANVTAEGTALVSSRLLAAIVRALPKGDVNFTIENNKLLVQADRSKFSLELVPEQDSLPHNPDPTRSLAADDSIDVLRSLVTGRQEKKQSLHRNVSIAVTSSKGGSGKSTTAMVLATQIFRSSPG